MFEIYFDEDDDSPVLAVHATAVAALADLDRIGDDTMAQLAANGEGHRCFWLRLAIRDTDSGEVVSRCAIVGQVLVRDDVRMAKYDPLRDHLRRQTADRVTMAFDEIAALVPGGLPVSAYQH